MIKLRLESHDRQIEIVLNYDDLTAYQFMDEIVVPAMIAFGYQPGSIEEAIAMAVENEKGEDYDNAIE